MKLSESFWKTNKNITWGPILWESNKKIRTKSLKNFAKSSLSYRLVICKLTVSLIWVSTRQFPSHTFRKFIFQNTPSFNGYWIWGPYGFWEVHTALDGPRTNQSNREFQYCYTIINRYSTTARRIWSDIWHEEESLLFFELELNTCFIIHQSHNPEWCIRKHISTSKKIKTELQYCNSEYVFKRHVRFILGLIYKDWFERPAWDLTAKLGPLLIYTNL